ncbi:MULTISPECIES: thioredoxin domain-containing protein [unclassified Streptomyces]|uniref:thioredoxin domain-containing protein n=1 Tax=unclassified Streptomyces TaxID=2593676 RepID=UPI00087E925B|nr:MULTISPECIES: thioredoxin domain-containing protein [unclassified Streptomyces]SDQ79359.1 Protein-disulfide isomerase [Streptomyces sp. KS_16]SEE03035.1 Protein-disulfide isomerase [Streptomyces sp. 2133.1]SNC73652.1 Protein-disulfide isomerase [Streptomyces sp. 2114.4]
MSGGRGRRQLAALALTLVLPGLLSSGCGERTAREPSPKKAAYGGPAKLPEKLDVDGTTIVVGDPEAPVTVHLYEDPRCPVCQEFEVTGGGPALRALTRRRETKTEYTFASFLDEKAGGGGSKRAVNALRAALEAGKFAEYHAVLYRHQPAEAVDGYTTALLLKLAGKVAGLRGPAFDSAVKTMRYRAFVDRSERAFDRAGEATPRGLGTPTAVINGVQLPEEYFGMLFDRKALTRFLRLMRYQPEQWPS